MSPLGLLVALTVFAVVVAEDVELEFHPPGPHKAGDTIKILCRVKAGEILDLVKIVKMVDTKEYQLSTDDYMTKTFMDTGRYSMQWSVTDEFKEAGFTIKKAKGEDSGMIGCKHILLDGNTFQAFEEFKVVVPPKSVGLTHYTNGVEHEITDGKIVLKEGEDGGIECVVVMDGSHDSPHTTITLGDKDIMHKFSKEENKTKNPNGGLVQMKAIITYEYLFANPDVEMNGQMLECSAHINGFDPVSSRANIEVHYKPRIKCGKIGNKLGKPVILECPGRMHPPPDMASVTWKRDGNSFTLSQSNPKHGRHNFTIVENGNDEYVFTLFINALEEEDYGTFKFAVQNSQGTTESKLTLFRVMPRITTTTIPTQPKAEAEYTVQRDAVGRASRGQSLIWVLILPVFVCFLRS